MRGSILRDSSLGAKDPLQAPHTLRSTASSTWSFPSASVEESGCLVSKFLHMYTHIAHQLGNAQEDMYTLSSTQGRAHPCSQPKGSQEKYCNRRKMQHVQIPPLFHFWNSKKFPGGSGNVGFPSQG